jgi:hypothetical protein
MKRQSAVLVLFLLALFAIPVVAQFETAEVLGTIHDPSGQVVAKATVTLSNQGTGIQATTTTDDNGNYDFFDVKIGLYTITVEATGFDKVSTQDVRVDVNARQRVDLTLQLGTVSQSVNVSDAASILQTDSSEHSQVVETQEIRELPLNGRNYADLALLATNTIKSPIAVAFSPSGTPREGAFNVNGMRSTYNNFLLDGIDNNAYGTSNQGYSAQVVQPSPDAMAEFQLISTNYSAEYGRVGGGVVNAAMRTGTNEFHGTAYEFLRNTDLNAIGYTFNPNPAFFEKPTLQRNQFGATFGGPLIKNKLFFFTDYEGYRQLQRYLNTDTLPTVPEQQGILPVTVVDPLTGRVFPAGTTIPVAQLNPFAAAALKGLPPLPASVTNPSNDDVALLLIRDYSDKYDARLDGQINDRMSLFARFSQRKDVQYYEPDLSGPSGGDGNGFIHAIDQQAALGYDWTVTPSSILDARLSWTRVLAGKTPPYVGSESLQDMGFDFPGLPTASWLTGGLNTQTVGGFSNPTFGRQTSNPQFQNPTSFGPKLNYSRTMGRHSLKTGYEFMMIRTEVLDVNPLYGQDSYSGGFSKPTCAELAQPAGCTIAASSTAYNLADFIFGLPSSINLGNPYTSNLRQHVHAVYVQDDWHVTSKLTLNLGLRWEFATPLWDRDNGWSNFDPATATMIRATSGSLYDRALVNPNYTDFGPRAGFAYNPSPNWVVRGGYGISYDFFNRPGSAVEGINAPNALFGVLTQSIPAGGAVPAGFLTTLNSFSTGIANPASFNPANSNIDYIPANSPWPLIQNFFFAVQRQVTGNSVVELSYNGNASLHLPIIADLNEEEPNASGALVKPYPSYGPITWVDPVGFNHYNGLSARFEHRFGSGLYFLNSFTWGKGIGDSEQALEYYPGYVEANPQNIQNLALERGPSSFDATFNNVTSMVYQLPFGKGRKLGPDMNPFLDAVVGGWEVNSINTAHTGTPINVYYNGSSGAPVSALSNDYRGEPFLRPNVSGSAASQSTAQMLNNYFDGYTFTTPPASSPFGDLGRNAFRGPGLEQWDFAADKTFHIGERVGVQFRSEFFNILNKTNFGIPNTNTASSAFGTIRTTYPARQIQFALKATF